MSKYLPVENIIYKTKLSKDEVAKKIDDNIEKQKAFGFGGNNYTYSKPYIGIRTNNKFEIKRVINYRNSFLPIIKGEIYTDYEGTKINISMKPQDFVLAFMILWLGGTTLACFATTYALFSQKFSPAFLVPYGMLLFGIVLFSGAFKTESKTSKEDLKRILEAEIV